MTFLVFIAYGGSRAKAVAEKLGTYLEGKGISTFVASSKLGKWLIPGEPNFDSKTWSKLQESDIMTLISTRKTCYSRKVREEVQNTIANKKPIIILTERGTKVPFSASLRESHWVSPLEFTFRHAHSIFPETAIRILLNMEQQAENREQLTEQLH